MQREKKTQPLPRSPVRGGSSPKCGPHLKTRGAAPAPQNPGLFPHLRGHNSHLSITTLLYHTVLQYLTSRRFGAGEQLAPIFSLVPPV